LEIVRVTDDFQYYSIATEQQALVNGAIHWFGNHERAMVSASPDLVVVLFHMCDEELRVMKLPAHLSSLKAELGLRLFMFLMDCFL
jgi:hypothetical protein